MANDRPTHASSLRAEPTRSVGLVLGAGGVAGWAWLVGCLAALEEEGGWDARQADLIVGTSAGAGVAALLRGGRSASEQLARYQEGATGSSVAAAADADRAAASAAPATPPLTDRIADGIGAARAGTGGVAGDHPGAGAGGGGGAGTSMASPAGGVGGGGGAGESMASPAGGAGGEPGAASPAAGAPLGPVERVRRAWPLAPQLALLGLARWPPRPGLVLAGGLPRGQHVLADLGNRLGELHGERWPEQPLWVTAVRADTGRRVVFGRDGGQPTDVASAVRASAAVPGWYEPVRIDGHDHLDGGAWSTTNADLVAGLGFDVALVLAPLSVATARLGRSTDRLRRAYHRSVLSREVDVVHRNGTDTVVLEPPAADLELLASGAGDLDGPRRLAIARRARQRVVERLADDPSLAAAIRARADTAT